MYLLSLPYLEVNTSKIQSYVLYFQFSCLQNLINTHIHLNMFCDYLIDQNNLSFIPTAVLWNTA